MDIIEKNQKVMAEFAKQSPKLATQLENLDWSELKKALDECLSSSGETGIPREYGPASYLPILPESPEQQARYEQAYEHGEQLIRDGRTATFTVAGGQGTRLGYDGPKGTLPVSPIKKKPLFQLFAEQILGMSLSTYFFGLKPKTQQ